MARGIAFLIDAPRALLRRLDRVTRQFLRKRLLARPGPRRLLRAWGLRRMGGLALSVGDRNSGFFQLGWCTLDMSGADYLADLSCQPIPLPDGSVKALYASHLLEHLDDEQAARLLREFQRVLRPGGLLRPVVPDLPRHVDEYRRDPSFAYFYQRADRPGHTVRDGLERAVAQGRQGAWALCPHNALFSVVVSYTNGHPWHDVSREELERQLAGSLEDFVRWCASQKDRSRPDFGHVNGYDHACLARMLSVAGFDRARASSWRAPDLDPVFRGMDRRDKREISLYVDAVRRNENGPPEGDPFRTSKETRCAGSRDSARARQEVS